MDDREENQDYQRDTGLFPLIKKKVKDEWFCPQALDRYHKAQAMIRNNEGAGQSKRIRSLLSICIAPQF